MNETSRALLLIADISGFTEFMRLHALATSHARHIIVRLLRALIQSSGPPFRVAELEGDAVFYYAVGLDENAEAPFEQAKKQILRLFWVFKREIQALQQLPCCVCDACTTVGKLRLKQVVHFGDVSIEPIQGFEKLFGFDVIIVHRMLKNRLSSNEYLMITRSAYAAFVDFFALDPESYSEEFEGVGSIDTVVFQEESLASAFLHIKDEPRSPSISKIFAWKLRMHGCTILELVGLRKKQHSRSVLSGP